MNMCAISWAWISELLDRRTAQRHAKRAAERARQARIDAGDWSEVAGDFAIWKDPSP